MHVRAHLHKHIEWFVNILCVEHKNQVNKNKKHLQFEFVKAFGFYILLIFLLLFYNQKKNWIPCMHVCRLCSSSNENGKKNGNPKNEQKASNNK